MPAVERNGDALRLLARLWSGEPRPEDLERARALGMAAGGAPPEHAQRFADVLLLGVPPYGSVFTDDAAELDGPSSRALAQLFRQHNFAPPELAACAAADHLGVCLLFLAGNEGEAAERVGREIALWSPVCCFAVEREAVERAPLLRDLALRTVERVLAGTAATAELVPARSAPALDDAETSLDDVAGYLLAPARCGAFLSRGRMGRLARTAGVAVPFAARRDLLHAIFRAAGENGRLPAWCASLGAELAAWSDHHREVAGRHPVWRSAGAAYAARALAARDFVAAVSRAAAAFTSRPDAR
jgi:hypothetical protein